MSEELLPCPFDNYEEIAETLHKMGWRSPCDAQWEHLKEWCEQMKSLWHTRRPLSSGVPQKETQELQPNGVGGGSELWEFAHEVKERKDYDQNEFNDWLEERLKKFTPSPLVALTVPQVAHEALEYIINNPDNSLVALKLTSKQLHGFVSKFARPALEPLDEEELYRFALIKSGLDAVFPIETQDKIINEQAKLKLKMLCKDICQKFGTPEPPKCQKCKGELQYFCGSCRKDFSAQERGRKSGQW